MEYEGWVLSDTGSFGASFPCSHWGKTAARGTVEGGAPAWHEGSWQGPPSGSWMEISCDHSLFFKPPCSVYSSLLTGKVPSPLLLLSGGSAARSSSLCVKCRRIRFCPCFLAFWYLKFHLPHWLPWGVCSFVNFIQETNRFLFPFLQLSGRNGFSRQRELIAVIGSQTVTCAVPGPTQVLGRWKRP